MGFDQPDALIIGSVLTFVLGLAGLYVQGRRNTSLQRSDHAQTAEMVREMHTDLREVRQDVRDVKAEVRSHGDRLRSLEHLSVVQDETDRIVADNARKITHKEAS